MRGSFRLGALLLIASVAAPAVGEQIVWSHDVDAAWDETVREGRPLLVFITRSQCKYCVQMKRATLVDEQVANQVMSEFVPLAIDPQSDPALIEELNIRTSPRRSSFRRTPRCWTRSRATCRRPNSRSG